MCACLGSHSQQQPMKTEGSCRKAQKPNFQGFRALEFNHSKMLSSYKMHFFGLDSAPKVVDFLEFLLFLLAF